jgi:hypothetical protein
MAFVFGLESDLAGAKDRVAVTSLYPSVSSHIFSTTSAHHSTFPIGAIERQPYSLKDRRHRLHPRQTRSCVPIAILALFRSSLLACDAWRRWTMNGREDEREGGIKTCRTPGKRGE